MYEGEWRDDAMNGSGTLTLANGAKYHGTWKADKRCGHGVYALWLLRKGKM